MKTKILTLIITLSLIFSVVCVPTKAMETKTKSGIVPEDAINYAYQHYKDILSDGLSFNISMEKDKNNSVKSIKLGTPFVVYEMDCKKQDEIYFFPIIDNQNTIITLMSVIGTTNGWTCSFSEEWVDEIKYKYESGTTKEFLNISDHLENIEYSKKNSKYNSRLNYIHTSEKNYFKKVDVEKIRAEMYNINDDYSPKFSVDNNSAKKCKLYNSKGQGEHGMCWAASVATICNYIKGTNHSALNVANKMRVGADEGANPSVAQKALKEYGVSYTHILYGKNNLMKWDRVKKNISNKNPIYISTKSETEGHAMTVFGCAYPAGEQYIDVWNSNANNGKGGTITVQFKTNGTVFRIGTHAFTWTNSVSKI